MRNTLGAWKFYIALKMVGSKDFSHSSPSCVVKSNGAGIHIVPFNRLKRETNLANNVPHANCKQLIKDAVKHCESVIAFWPRPVRKSFKCEGISWLAAEQDDGILAAWSKRTSEFEA
jgi:hypothetical protein